MIKTNAFVAALVCAGLSAAPALADPSTNLDESIEGLAVALAAEDAARSAAHYAEDALVMPPDSPAIEGAEAIEGFWQAVFDAGVTGIELNPTAVHASGRLASETGTFSLVSPSDSGPVTVTGKYIVVWERGGDGHWRAIRDIWNATPQ